MKKKLLLTLVIALLSQVGAVQAQEETISVSVPDLPGQGYTLTIFGIGKSTQSGELSDIVYLKEAKAVSDSESCAKVDFVIDFYETSGYYPYIIKSVASDWSEEGTLNFVNDEEWQAARSDLATALSSQDPGTSLKGVFETHKDIFLLDSNFPIGSEIKLLDTTKAYNYIADNITASVEISDLQRVYQKAMLICGIEKGTDSMRVNIATNYETALELDTDTLTSTKYASLSETTKLEIAKMEKGDYYADPVSYILAHRDALCTASVNAATSWQTIGTVISDFNTVCSLGFSTTNEDIKNLALMELARNKPYESKTDLITAITTAIRNAQNGGTYNNSSSSTSGVGSSRPSTSPSTSISPIPPTPSTPGAGNGFNDIENVSWAKDAIEYLADKEIIHGKGNNTFAPNDSIKREEFAKILVEAFECEGGVAVEFEDVEQEQWYAPYINMAVEAGFVSGYSESVFGVGNSITRQDACVMLARAAGFDLENAGDGAAKFRDKDDISSYALAAVSVMAEKGLVNGTTNGEFLPKKPITRAEAAKILYDYLTGGKI